MFLLFLVLLLQLNGYHDICNNRDILVDDYGSTKFLISPITIYNCKHDAIVNCFVRYFVGYS